MVRSQGPAWQKKKRKNLEEDDAQHVTPQLGWTPCGHGAPGWTFMKASCCIWPQSGLNYCAMFILLTLENNWKIAPQVRERELPKRPAAAARRRHFFVLPRAPPPLG